MQEALFELFKTFEHMAKLGQALVTTPPPRNVVAQKHEPEIESEDEPELGYSQAELERMRKADEAQSKAEAEAFRAIQESFKDKGVDILNQLQSKNGLMRSPEDILSEG